MVDLDTRCGTLSFEPDHSKTACQRTFEETLSRSNSNIHWEDPKPIDYS